MTLLQRLQAIVQAMNDILTLAPQVQTALTDLNSFLDTI